MKKLILGLILTFNAFAGGSMDSGGGDLHSPDYGAAWFFGKNETVSCCAQFDKSFPVKEDKTLDIIQKVFKQWLAYIDKKHAEYWMYGDRPANSKYLTRNYKYKLTCDTTVDLTFYFGIENKEVLTAKRAYTNPQALSQKQKYDLNTGWGKGFIWLNSKNENPYKSIDWSQNDKLHAILLHEIGHVFGNGYMPGTIMSSTLPYALSMGYLEDAGLKIDHHNQLMTAWDLVGKPREALVDIYDKRSKEMFQKLTGSIAQGEVTAELTIESVDPKKHHYFFIQ